MKKGPEKVEIEFTVDMPALGIKKGQKKLTGPDTAEQLIKQKRAKKAGAKKETAKKEPAKKKAADKKD